MSIKSHILRHRVLAAGLALVLALAGCGGGGGGKDPAVTSSADTSGAATPPVTVTGKNVSVTVSQSAVKFTTYLRDNGRYTAQKVSVQVSYEGDGVLVGFAPGVTPPAWLKVPQTNMVAPSKSFTLDIEALATTQAEGTYTVSLRLVGGKADGSDVAIVDLPITLTVAPMPPIYPAAIVTMQATQANAGLTEQTIALDFGAATGAQYTAVLDNANSIASNWLALTSTPSSKTLRLAPKAGTKPGVYEAYARVDYALPGVTGSRRLPVRLVVVPSGPSVTYVVPALQYLNQPATTVVRGFGFSQTPPGSVLIGATATTDVTVVNDTQIIARFATLPNPGVWPLTLRYADRDVIQPEAVEVRMPTVLAAASIPFDEVLYEAKYDARKQAIVARTASKLVRLAQVNGTWVRQATRELVVGSMAFSPDDTQLIVSSPSEPGHLLVLDAQSLNTLMTLVLPNGDLGATGFEIVEVLGVANNGDALLGLRAQVCCTQAFVGVYNLANHTLRRSAVTGAWLAGQVRTSFWRDRILMLPSDGYLNFAGFYRAEDGAFAPVADIPESVISNRIAYAAGGGSFVANDLFFNGQQKTSTAFWLTDVQQTSSPSLYYYELSAGGKQLYLVGATSHDPQTVPGRIWVYDTTQPLPWTKVREITFPAYGDTRASFSTAITPDDQAVLIAGTSYPAGGSGPVGLLTVVPLR